MGARLGEIRSGVRDLFKCLVSLGNRASEDQANFR